MNKNKNNNNKKLKSLLKINSLFNINTNYTKNKNNRNYLNKNVISTNSLSDFWKNNNHINKHNKNIPKDKSKYFSSNTTKRFYNHNSEQYESCISLTGNAFSNRQKNKNISIKKNKPKKNEKTCQDKSKNDSFIKFTEKCDLLKTKANKILSNYIWLVEYINNSKGEK